MNNKLGSQRTCMNNKMVMVITDPKTGEKFIQHDGKRIKILNACVIENKNTLTPMKVVKKADLPSGISNYIPQLKNVNPTHVSNSCYVPKADKIAPFNADTKGNTPSRVEYVGIECAPLNGSGADGESLKTLDASQSKSLVKTNLKDMMETNKSLKSIEVQTDITREEMDKLLNTSNIQEMMNSDFSEILDDLYAGSIKHLGKKRLHDELRSAFLPDNNGNMPIHQGVITNSITKVRRSTYILEILKVGVDLENSKGYTALQLAVIHDTSIEIINHLLTKNAQVTAADEYGNTLLHLAVEYGGGALNTIIQYAKLQKVDLDTMNNEGLTPLMVACINNSYSCAQLLLQYGASKDVKDGNSGRTALFHAVEQNNLEMVKLLLSNKANTKIKNFFGTSPHDAMFEINVSDEIKNLILNAGSKKRSLDGTIPPLRSRETDEDDCEVQLNRKKLYTKHSKMLRTYPNVKKINPEEYSRIIVSG